MWNPNTTPEMRLARAQMLQLIRSYFNKNHVLEVETPALSQAANTDPYIESINTNTQHYLHTSPEYPMKSAQLFLEKFSINPHYACKKELISCVKTEIPSLETNDLDQQALLDALLTHSIEPNFDTDCLTFVYDYPASQSALAQLRQKQDYAVAERFEVYLGDLELGNGYQEETDPKRNRDILETENQTRKDRNLELMPVDEHFLSACDSGIPKSAGVAIGLDRVLMAITGEKSIQKVINFPWDKA